MFLPTELKDSMRFFQVPSRRLKTALGALATYLVIDFILILSVGMIAMAVNPDFMNNTTPETFLLNNLSIVSEIVICSLIAWLFFKQGVGWLVSVVGRIRWRWLGLTMGLFAAGYAIRMAIEIPLLGLEGAGIPRLEMQPYTWFMIVAILLTTPLQCAGEEFQYRALLPRLISAVLPFKGVSFWLSGVVPSAIFVVMHNSSDLWLNLNYFCTAMMLWWLAYRTGGIEASIAFHVVHNMFSLWVLPFVDISKMFDRSEGVGSPEVLISLAVQMGLILLVDHIARQRGLVRLSSPAAYMPQVVKPRDWILQMESATYPATADLPLDAAPQPEPQPQPDDPSR